MRRYEERKDDQGKARELDVSVKLSVLGMLVPTDIGDYLTWEEYLIANPHGEHLETIDTDEEAMQDISSILQDRARGRLKKQSSAGPSASSVRPQRANQGRAQSGR